jgi:hypothetical protein
VIPKITFKVKILYLSAGKYYFFDPVSDIYFTTAIVIPLFYNFGPELIAILK